MHGHVTNREREAVGSLTREARNGRDSYKRTTTTINYGDLCWSRRSLAADTEQCITDLAARREPNEPTGARQIPTSDRAQHNHGRGASLPLVAGKRIFISNHMQVALVN